MASTSTLHVRIDETLKENAEAVLAQLGLTPSDAIKLFYRQVELHGGLPFEIKIPHRALAEKRLFDELERGEREAKENGWMTIAESKKALGL